MATRPESKFSRKFTKATSHSIHWTRIESWALPGVPDLHGVCPNKCFWIETKECPLLNVKLKGLTPKQMGMRPYQIQWQINYARHGGEVYNLVHRPSSKLVQLYPHATLSEGPWSVLFEAKDDDDGLRSVVDFVQTLA